MTDSELIREVVVKCMGWFDNFGDGKTWYKNAGYKEAGEKMAEFVCSQVDFNPLTNLNHAFMVVEKLREKGWESCIRNTPEIPPDDWEASFSKRGRRMYGSFHKNLGTAIALAALKTEGE